MRVNAQRRLSLSFYCSSDHVGVSHFVFKTCFIVFIVWFQILFLGDLRQVTGAKLKDIAARIRSSGGHATTRLGSIMRKVRKPFGPRFVAAFCQSNVGDTSPNTLGAFCLDSGIPCDFDHSTCNGKNELCVGRGPA